MAIAFQIGEKAFKWPIGGHLGKRFPLTNNEWQKNFKKQVVIFQLLSWQNLENNN